MISRWLGFDFLEKYKEYGPIPLRILIGAELIRGTQDNVFSHERMVEFMKFLEQSGFPFPAFGAYLSAYAQFLCGILFILGLGTRAAGAVMVINFLFALGIAHVGAPYQANYPAFIMLAAALFFFVHGAGKPSLDDGLEKRRSGR
jgi:putative oxidoreductase